MQEWGELHKLAKGKQASAYTHDELRRLRAVEEKH
jgi:hypothetical protein